LKKIQAYENVEKTTDFVPVYRGWSRVSVWRGKLCRCHSPNLASWQGDQIWQNIFSQILCDRIKPHFSSQINANPVSLLMINIANF
jgi:hypothetical protein